MSDSDNAGADLRLKSILEAILFSAGKPLTPEQMLSLFPEDDLPSISEIKQALEILSENYKSSGIKLQQVASGYRFQVRQRFIPWVSKLWSEKPPRYTRALLETLALVAYRQPITRGEIEEIRGVAVSSHIIRTLQEREWVRVVGRREVPGRPAMYATTRQFLDYFNLSSLNDLPPLGELRDIDAMANSLDNKVENNTVLSPESDQPTNSVTEIIKSRQPQKEKQETALVDHDTAKAFQQERAKADEEVFASVDELLASVKTDFNDFTPENCVTEE